MPVPKIPWSNPYRTKLWLFSYNSDTFCKKELELWDYLAGFGPRGCRDTNTQLGLRIHRSRATVKRYIHNIEKHWLIVRVPGWAELAGGRFVRPLRYRRIVALPWPSKGVWMEESYRQMIKLLGSKMSHYQRRTMKHSINQQRDDLFFGRPVELPENVSPPGTSTQPNPQSPGGSTTGGSVNDSQLLELVRKGCIEKLVKVGYPRGQAIKLANVKVQELLERKKIDL